MPTSLMSDELLRVVDLKWTDGSLRLSNDEWDYATEHWFVDLDGWIGGVGIEGDQPQRALGHGALPRDGRRTTRTLTLKGELHFPDQSDREIAARYVSGILGDGKYGTLCVTTEGLSQWADVRLDGAIKWGAEGSEWFYVEIPLTAPRPFIYGAAKTAQVQEDSNGLGLQWDGGLFSGGLLRWGGVSPNPLLTNNGNADSWPTFTVRGDFPRGFRLRVGRDVIEYPEPVYSRSPVTVDVASGRVRVNRRDVSHLLTSRDWIRIPPRSSITPILSGLDQNSVGVADVAWTDTYL